MTDLDRKADDHHDRKYIQERNHQFRMMLDQPFEDRLNDQQHSKTKDTDNQKMKLFIGQIETVIVIYGLDFRMKPGNQRYEIVNNPIHRKPPLHNIINIKLPYFKSKIARPCEMM